MTPLDRALTRLRLPDRRWLRLVLVPFRVRRLPNRADGETYVSKYDASIWLEDSRSKRAQRAVYRALLQCRWLAPKVRNAIVTELGMSVRQQRRRGSAVRAKFLRAEIAEQKRRMRENGERPRGGIHDAAFRRVAKRHGTTVEALVKQLQRSRRNDPGN
jgi:hypothetical protein